jgi:1-deoxy-D-xylulose 5-phosphate reductoisomerase
MTTRTITILGATGSIGASTLDLVRRDRDDRWRVVALTANGNAAELARLAREFGANWRWWPMRPRFRRCARRSPGAGSRQRAGQRRWSRRRRGRPT